MEQVFAVIHLTEALSNSSYDPEMKNGSAAPEFLVMKSFDIIII
jgi:hypothetical protein